MSDLEKFISYMNFALSFLAIYYLFEGVVSAVLFLAVFICMYWACSATSFLITNNMPFRLIYWSVAAQSYLILNVKFGLLNPFVWGEVAVILLLLLIFTLAPINNRVE